MNYVQYHLHTLRISSSGTSLFGGQKNVMHHDKDSRHVIKCFILKILKDVCKVREILFQYVMVTLCFPSAVSKTVLYTGLLRYFRSLRDYMAIRFLVKYMSAMPKALQDIFMEYSGGGM
jgi:hypothetical protein